MFLDVSLVEYVSNNVTVMWPIYAVVYSGQQIKVLGENYTLEDEEDLRDVMWDIFGRPVNLQDLVVWHMELEMINYKYYCYQ